MIKKTCQVCNKEFIVTLSLKRMKFCSRKCYYKSRLGYKHSEETKEKMSISSKGHIVSQETRDKLSFANKGYKHTEEAKKKMSITRKGKPQSPNQIFSLKNIHIKQIGKFGSEANGWKGGRCKRSDGYIEIWQPHHPFPNRKGYVLEHRLIMEKQLNRFLTSEEIVHHINRIRDDNRKENLELFKNNSEHSKYHLYHNHIYHF